MKKILIVVCLSIPGFIAAAPDEDLLKAAESGDLAGVKNALAAGAKINAINKYGISSLIWASNKGYIEIVKYLVSKRADVNLANVGGYTAFMHAAKFGHDDILKHLISHGARLNLKNHDLYTALMLAAEKGQVSAVKILIQAKADLNVKGPGNKTALMLATDANQKNARELLLSAGATDYLAGVKSMSPVASKSAEPEFKRQKSNIPEAQNPYAVWVGGIYAVKGYGPQGLSYVGRCVISGNPKSGYSFRWNIVRSGEHTGVGVLTNDTLRVNINGQIWVYKVSQGGALSGSREPDGEWWEELTFQKNPAERQGQGNK